MSCVFCEIVVGVTTPSTRVVEDWPDAFAMVPLGPVVEGHVLVIPKAHVHDFGEDPVVTGATFARAAQYADRLPVPGVNLITSAGPAATQSVFHLHIHVIPRHLGDGLALPWHDGHHKEAP